VNRRASLADRGLDPLDPGSAVVAEPMRIARAFRQRGEPEVGFGVPVSINRSRSRERPPGVSRGELRVCPATSVVRQVERGACDGPVGT